MSLRLDWWGEFDDPPVEGDVCARGCVDGNCEAFLTFCFDKEYFVVSIGGRG